MAAHGRERARAGGCVIAHQRGIRVRPRRWEAIRRWWGVCRAVARLLGPVRVPFNESLGAARRRPRCGSLLAGLLWLVLIRFGHGVLPLWVGWHVRARPSDELTHESHRTPTRTIAARRISPKKIDSAPRSLLSCAWLVTRGPSLQRPFVSSVRASLTRSVVGGVPAASSSVPKGDSPGSNTGFLSPVRPESMSAFSMATFGRGSSDGVGDSKGWADPWGGTSDLKAESYPHFTWLRRWSGR